VLGDPSPGAAVAAALARAPFATLRAALRGWLHRHARGFRLAAGLRSALVPEIRNADALLAHYGPTGLQFLSVALLARRPYAVYFHGYDVGRVLAEDPQAYEMLFRSGASLLTNSDFLRDRLVAAGAAPERVRVVPLGVDPRVAQAVHEPASPPRVLTIARLVPKKGLEDALRAFAETIAGLVSDTKESQRLGDAAREWVAATHSRERFLRAFRELARELTEGGPRL